MTQRVKDKELLEYIEKQNYRAKCGALSADQIEINIARDLIAARAELAALRDATNSAGVHVVDLCSHYLRAIIKAHAELMLNNSEIALGILDGEINRVRRG